MGLFSRKRSKVAEDVSDEVDEPDDDDAEEAAEAEGDDVGADVEETDSEVAAAADDVDVDADGSDDEDDEPSEGGRSEDDDEDDDDEDDDDGVEDLDEGEPTGQVEFELADWGQRERQLIESELDSLRVRRAWEASTLVVAASDADVVDDLIDIIEERIALDLSPDVEPVIYEVGDWPAGLEDRFVEALIDNRIAHLRGYQEVTVGVDDEERVDDLVETVTAAWEDEQPDEDELDGPDAQQVLSELFIGADRLLHDPSDKPGTVRFDDAAGAALEMKVPFGFDEAAWAEITDRVGTLRDRLNDEDASDDDVVEAATELRTHLRPMV